jgi:hypothetical protein
MSRNAWIVLAIIAVVVILWIVLLINAIRALRETWNDDDTKSLGHQVMVAGRPLPDGGENGEPFLRRGSDRP